jgi:transposase
VAWNRYEEWLTERGLGMVEAWCQDGLEDRQLAAAMKISLRTLQDWKRRFAPIAAAISRGRGYAQVQIENALFQRAKGYNEKVMKPFKVRKREYDPETKRCIREEEVIEYHEEETHVPADVNAAKFWLTNRAPERWSEKVLVENTGELTLEQLLRQAGTG